MMFDSAQTVDEIGAETVVTQAKPKSALSERETQVLSEVADWLESGRAKHNVVGFDMGGWISPADENRPECGTVCCIAGAIIQFNGGYKGDGWRHNALSVLGVGDSNDPRYYELFAPQTIHAMQANPPWAARTIRHFITTGEVNWAATYTGNHDWSMLSDRAALQQ